MTYTKCCKDNMRHVFTSKFLVYSVVFGFYLGPMRSDQILILIFGFLALVKLLKSAQPITIREIFVLLSLVFFIVIGVLSFFFNEKINLTLLFVAQLENYVSLIAIYLIWLFYFKNRSLSQLVDIQKSFIFAICLVTVLNLFAWLLGHEVLSMFHVAEIGDERPELKGMTLLELTKFSGRYPGTFGQIFEAGTAYFLAFLSVLSIRRFYSKRLSWLASLSFVTIGGLLVGSKIFIVGSIVVIFLYSFKASKIFFTLLCTVQLTALAVILRYDVALPWQFSRLIKNLTLENIFNIYTSFRFAEGSGIITGMMKIFEESPVVGMGFGYLGNSDFSLYEVLAISGIIGVVVYAVILVCMYYDSRLKQDVLNTSLIIVFICTISISAPAITANKIGFLLLTCFLTLKRVWRETK